MKTIDDALPIARDVWTSLAVSMSLEGQGLSQEFLAKQIEKLAGEMLSDPNHVYWGRKIVYT
jgi:hypothetical protein